MADNGLIKKQLFQSVITYLVTCLALWAFIRCGNDNGKSLAGWSWPRKNLTSTVL